MTVPQTAADPRPINMVAAAGTPRYRAAYALAFATFPLIFLGNHPISVCYFSKHRRTEENGGLVVVAGTDDQLSIPAITSFASVLS